MTYTSANEKAALLNLRRYNKEHFFLDDPFGGECMNCMQAGLRLATKVIAVSAGYAWEITTAGFRPARAVVTRLTRAVCALRFFAGETVEIFENTIVQFHR